MNTISFEDIIKRLTGVVEGDFELPVRQMQDRHADQLIKFLEYRYNTELKNIDVLIDLLKLLLSVSGSILIAKYSLQSFPINTIAINFIFITLVVLLFIALRIRTRTSKNAIDKYNEFLDLEAASLKDSTDRYFDRRRNAIRDIEKDINGLTKKRSKKK